MGYAKFLLYGMGKQSGVGARKIEASLPIYKAEICVPLSKIYIIEECVYIYSV